MSTSHAQFSALHNPPFLRKVVTEFPSLRALAKSLGVGRKTLKKALERYEIPPPDAAVREQYQRHLAAQKKRASIERRQGYYHAKNAAGRRRQALIRQIARGRQEGQTVIEIAAAIGISERLCKCLAAKPLTRALLWAWGDIRLTEPERYALAYAMVDAGFDQKVIARTLEVDPTAYAKKLGVEI